MVWAQNSLRVMFQMNKSLEYRVVEEVVVVVVVVVVVYGAYFPQCEK
jgi:hypothetical protein